ncbi:hypothetical protein KQX54_001423 [Cotesia glomerata]|uniref:Uncharacterized protein n=1 Tax=Cotesia glomerata TaxID=32391 RepID=A0AAV7I2I6_COTGL|nr:hypothetical protein KQX54_001423 [Cotesia glomerata]
MDNGYNNGVGCYHSRDGEGNNAVKIETEWGFLVKCNVGPEPFNRINDLGGKIKGVKEVKILDGRNKRIKVEIASQIGERDQREVVYCNDAFYAFYDAFVVCVRLPAGNNSVTTTSYTFRFVVLLSEVSEQDGEILEDKSLPYSWATLLIQKLILSYLTFPFEKRFLFFERTVVYIKTLDNRKNSRDATEMKEIF